MELDNKTVCREKQLFSETTNVSVQSSRTLLVCDLLISSTELVCMDEHRFGFT